MSNTIKLEVSKTVQKGGANVREKVGEVEVYCPALQEFGLAIEPVGQEEDGSLKYAELAHQWLYNAIQAAVKGQARNRLQPGSVELKPNNKLATTLEELVTPSETGAVVLAERRALLEAFKTYLATLAKPENVKKLLLTFIDKPETLALQPADARAKIKVYFEEFGNSIAERLTQWQGDYLVNVIAQCEAEEVEF